ncbi:16038_t:CDS:2, partial [Racocetra persica]
MGSCPNNSSNNEASTEPIDVNINAMCDTVAKRYCEVPLRVLCGEQCLDIRGQVDTEREAEIKNFFDLLEETRKNNAYVVYGLKIKDLVEKR